MLAFILMVIAAMTVNKEVFGHKIENQYALSDARESVPQVAADTITSMPDGVTIIHTAAVADSINGFAGPVPLDIYIRDGKIQRVEALPNGETPSFFNRAAALLDKWNGMTPQEAVSVKVDAISGATYSSEAIKANVSAGLGAYLGHEERQREDIPWKIWIALGVTLAACIIPLFVRNRIYNNMQLIANIIVLGFWCGMFLDYRIMLRYISDGFVFPGGLVAILMLIAAFIYPLFGKSQHYCNHICPLGSAQLLVAQICRYKIHISQKVLKGLDWFRKILWALLMLALWLDCYTEWMDFELFQAFQYRSASWWIIGAACVFVALSAVVSRPYCRFVCPTGSLFKRAENLG